MTSAMIKVLIVGVLLASTVAWFTWGPRFETAGDPVPMDMPFQANLAGWAVEGGEGSVTAERGSAILSNTDPARSVRLIRAVPLDPGTRKFRLTAEAASEDVIAGARKWHTGRVLMASRAEDGRILWRRLQLIARLTGTTPWAHFEGVYTVPREAAEAVVMASLTRATGTLKVRNVTVEPVRASALFWRVADGLLVAWTLALLWIAVGVLRGIRSRGTAIAAGVLALAVVGGVLMPSAVKERLAEVLGVGDTVLRAVIPSLIDVSGETDKEAKFIIGSTVSQTENLRDSLVHAALFFLLTIAARHARPQDRHGHQIGFLLAFAAVSEVLQFFTRGRTPTLDDWLVDAGGVMAAGLVLLVMARRRSRQAPAAGRPSP